MSSVGDRYWKDVSSVGNRYWKDVSSVGNRYWKDVSSVRNRCWKDVSSVGNGYWKDVSSVAQLSNMLAQPASMLAQPSSMMAQLRIWIGCGSDLIFERRPEASSKARFSQAADQGPTRGRPGANQGPEPPQTRGRHLWPLVLKGRAPGF